MLEFEGIGTHWWIENLQGFAFDDETVQAIHRYVQTFDEEYSRFKPTSYIGALNTKKILKNPPEKLLAMFAFCHELYLASEGAFDITVGGVLHAQGYGSRDNASKVVADFWDEVKCNRDEIRIPGGAVIDTGGYGKGWLIDDLVELLSLRGYTQVIVNGGGDLRITSNEPVEFALEHPYDTSKRVGSTRIRSGALSVSGTAKRQWEFDGVAHNHIVDPVSGESLHNDVAATYVQSETALLADSLATILMIRPDLKDALVSRYAAKVVILYDNQLA